MEPQKKPEIPSLKDSGKLPQPQLKIKGLAASLSFVDRLKQFKKKDLAFIFAGLGVLFMAPLAEHFMMSPEGTESGAFKEGWSFRGDAGGFGSGQSPYEGGANGLAPGSLLGGGGSDVITPLNVRDPSALIMGPGQSAPQPVTAPPATTQSASPAKASGGDWKDALANAAGRGAKEAVKAASLPVPKVPLQGGLRGLGAVSGGGGGSFSLPALSASGVPNTAAGSNSLQKVGATAGYKGVAGPRGKGPNTGGLEDLKKAAGAAATEFNRGGSGATNLDNAAAASQALPSGGADGGGGGGGQGTGDKTPGGNQDKGSKQQGESLEFLIAKENAMKQLELDWELKKKKAMMWPNMKEKMFETFMTKGIAEPVSKMFADFLTGDGHEKEIVWACADSSIHRKVGKCGGEKAGESGGKCAGSYLGKTNMYYCSSCGTNPIALDCKPEKGDKPAPAPKPEGGKTPVDIPTVGGKPLNKSCEDIATSASLPNRNSPKLREVATKMLTAARGLVESRDALVGDPTTMCGAQAIVQRAPVVRLMNLKGAQGEMLTKLGSATRADGIVGKMMESLGNEAAIMKSAIGKINEKAANGGTDSRVEAVANNLCGDAAKAGECDDTVIQKALDGVHGTAQGGAAAVGPFDKIAAEGAEKLEKGEDVAAEITALKKNIEETNGLMDKVEASMVNARTLLNNGFENEVDAAVRESGYAEIKTYYTDLRALVAEGGAVSKAHAEAKALQSFLNGATGKADLAQVMVYGEYGVVWQDRHALGNIQGKETKIVQFPLPGPVAGYPQGTTIPVGYNAQPTGGADNATRQNVVPGLSVEQFVKEIKAGTPGKGISARNFKLPFPTKTEASTGKITDVAPLHTKALIDQNYGAPAQGQEITAYTAARNEALGDAGTAKAAFDGDVVAVLAVLNAAKGLNGQAEGTENNFPANSAAEFVGEIILKDKPAGGTPTPATTTTTPVPPPSEEKGE